MTTDIIVCINTFHRDHRSVFPSPFLLVPCVQFKVKHVIIPFCFRRVLCSLPGDNYQLAWWAQNIFLSPSPFLPKPGLRGHNEISVLHKCYAITLSRLCCLKHTYENLFAQFVFNDHSSWYPSKANFRKEDTSQQKTKPKQLIVTILWVKTMNFLTPVYILLDKSIQNGFLMCLLRSSKIFKWGNRGSI